MPRTPDPDDLDTDALRALLADREKEEDERIDKLARRVAHYLSDPELMDDPDNGDPPRRHTQPRAEKGRRSWF